MIAIIDYGMGNLRSVQKAFEKVGAEALVTSCLPRKETKRFGHRCRETACQVTVDQTVVESASALVLPGVGAFGDAMANLREAGLVRSIHQAIEEGKPLLGICLGMQLLFEISEEMGVHQGLGVFKGRVRKFNVNLKVPHMGWNQIHIQTKTLSEKYESKHKWQECSTPSADGESFRFRRPDPLLRGVADGSYVYFVHSYYVEPADPEIVLATTDYGIDYASIIGRDAIYGIQFHPEKSQDVGLKILHNFAAMGGIG